jgi:hypothetical protein
MQFKGSFRCFGVTGWRSHLAVPTKPPEDSVHLKNRWTLCKTLPVGDADAIQLL